jgi:uncharacterized membrane protein YhaH (DUF805 family)
MTFQEAIVVCLRKYADFYGRATRAEYWWFVLFFALAFAAAAVISEDLAAVFSIAMLLPLLSAGTRRLRDTGRSGWLQLFIVVPFAGAVVLAILLSQETLGTSVSHEPMTDATVA